MATIKFFIQSKNNTAGVYVRLRDGRTVDAKAKTRFAINPADWSSIKGQPKNLKDESFKKLHNDLSKLSIDILNHYNASSGMALINSDWLKEFLNPTKPVGEIPKKLVDYFDYYALHKRSTVELSTHKKLKVYKRLLERFEKETGTTFLISDVNSAFKLRFETYCAKENYAPNTIARAVKFIKTICFHARDNGIETHYQLNSLKVKLEKVENIFLTLEDIEKIENAKLEHDYLINARDWLIISCETGQRVSDFMRFKKEQIRYEGTKPLIEFTQVKTGKIMAVPLSGKVMAILQNRNGEFPRDISDQRYNDYIKEVCKIAELNEKINGSKSITVNKVTRKQNGTFEKWELVTSHIGRRSFATNNYGRVPTSLLISATGHSTETMFLEYIGKTVTEKAIQLAEYF